MAEELTPPSSSQAPQVFLAADTHAANSATPSLLTGQSEGPPSTPPDPPESALQRFGGWLRSRFVAGLFIVVPIGLTVWVVSALYHLINGPLDHIIRILIEARSLPASDYFIAHHGGTIPFAGFTMTLLLIVLIGAFVQNFVGQYFMRQVERLIQRVPVVKQIYQGVRDMIDSIQQFSNPEQGGQFRHVVLVPISGNQSYAIGFLTGFFHDDKGRSFGNVFVPTPPNPFNGLLYVVSEKEIVYAHYLSIEQATKMIISLGMITPKAALENKSVHAPHGKHIRAC